MAPQEFAKILLNEMSTEHLPVGVHTKLCQSDPWAVSCNETINQLIILYINSLSSMLNDLQSYLTGAVFSHSDDFQFVTDLVQNSGKYGMENYSLSLTDFTT
ncbi:hypothetical protein ACSBR2_039742 [Camellia fascicularis]